VSGLHLLCALQKLASPTAFLEASKILAKCAQGSRLMRFRVRKPKQYLALFVKQPRCKVVVWLSIFTMITAIDAADAGPFRDFFRAIRSAVAHPKATPRPHRSRQKHNETPPSDVSSRQTSANPAPTSSSQRDIRWAKAASGASQQQTELPYGTPVGGKPGFVTSPFAPDSGYVDVTGFPPGTAVEDPYTGKIFLTP
jgi:hypothetical protein